MKHLRWESNGRTFQFTDDLGQVVPNKFVYKSYAGQKNVEQNGEYFPYVWDKEKNILYFGTCEVRLTDTQVEFWQKDTKLLATAVHPEVQEASIWNRKDAIVSGLRITEHPTENACDKITIAYDVTTEDQKGTVEIKVGGNNWARPSFILEAKQSERLRLTLVYDRKGTPVEDFDRQGKPLPIHRYDFGKNIWSWVIAEQEDHALEQLVSISELHLLEKDYQATEVRKVSPDTWGPYETGDDCDDVNGDYEDYYDDSGTYILSIGNWWGDVCCAGWIWDNVQASGTAEDGCKITVYVHNIGGSGCTAQLKVSDEDNPVAWDASHYPSNTSYHATVITWNEASTGSQDSPEIKTQIQLRFDDPTWDTYKKIKFGWIDNGSGSGSATDIIAEEDTSSGEDGGQLTIVYSTGGGGADLSHLNGVALSSLSHLNGVALSSLSHWNGITVQ